MLEGTLIKSQRELDLTIEYLPPLMSESHDQDNQPVRSEQDGSDQSEAMKESQEAGGSEPMKTAVTSSGDVSSENKSEEKIDTQAGSQDDNGEKKVPLETTEITEPSHTKWESCQGIYTGACVTIGSLKMVSETAVPLEDCTRLLLNRPSGRIGSLMFIMNLMSRERKALESPQVEHMLLKEYKVKLNNPSDPGSEMGKKEQMVTLDGEIFQLKQPEFHARLHPKLVKLFASATEGWCGETVK